MKSTLTRREFLERAALTGAALAYARHLEAAETMFVSLNGAVTRGVSGADRARLAAKVGYGGVGWGFGPMKKGGGDAAQTPFSRLKKKPTVVKLSMGGPLPLRGG